MLINMPSQVRTQQHKICYMVGTMIWIFNRGITLFSIQSKITAFIFSDLHYSESEKLGKKENEWKILIIPYSPGLEYKLWPMRQIHSPVSRLERYGARICLM